MTVTRRAYSYLTIKAVNEEKRIIRGIATTPAVDRVGDVVEPLGVKFTNPMPFLWQHDHSQPIGTVKFDKPTANGITFEAEIPILNEPGTLKDRIDEAWQSIKLGLVRAVSIGFRAIEYSFIENGGIRFSESEVYELSAVTIPAQPDAVMTSIKNMDEKGLALVKQFDTNAPAATGTIERPVDVSPGASGKSHKPVNLRPKEGTEMKTIAEQIAALEASRSAKAARMAEVMQKSMDEGRSTDQAEQEEFDTLEQEVEAIDGDLKRLRALEKAKAAEAKPISGQKAEEGSAARAAVVVKAAKPEPGIRLARYARCLALAQKGHRDIMQVAEEQYGNRDPEVVGMVKAAVIASNTTTDAALIGNEGGWADFVDFLRPRTILGQFGTDGRPSLTRIPFRVPLITESGESTAYWVGEGKAKPLTKPAWSRTELNPLKVATIAVATMEQLRDSSPAAEQLIRNSLANAVAKRIDQSFIDETNSGSAGVSPASILNGVAGITSSGVDADAIRTDVAAVMGAFVTANNPLNSGVWIMSATRALQLSLMMNPLGQQEFNGITMRGGTFMGLPVIVSQYVASDVVALVNAEDIYLGDDGGITIDMSMEASLEMMDNPTGDAIAATPVAAELVSLWQTNSVGFRAERTLNWMRRRATAVAWLDAVAWGDAS